MLGYVLLTISLQRGTSLGFFPSILGCEFPSSTLPFHPIRPLQPASMYGKYESDGLNVGGYVAAAVYTLTFGLLGLVPAPRKAREMAEARKAKRF